MKRSEKIEFFKDDNKAHSKCQERYLKKNFSVIYKEILDFSSDLNIPFKEKIWFWINEITEKPICEVCDNDVKFWNIFDGYAKTCSIKCSNKSQSKKDNFIKTSIKKYGVEHPNKNKDIKKKLH